MCVRLEGKRARERDRRSRSDITACAPHLLHFNSLRSCLLPPLTPHSLPTRTLPAPLPAQGTVVDTTICSPRDWDFYLVAHQGIQGTSRPIKYTVAFDENAFDANKMQALCWKCVLLFSSPPIHIGCLACVSLPQSCVYVRRAPSVLSASVFERVRVFVCLRVPCAQAVPPLLPRDAQREPRPARLLRGAGP